MISFISGTRLKKEPCCKFMLKHDNKNYFRQFTKTFYPDNTHRLKGTLMQI